MKRVIPALTTVLVVCLGIRIADALLAPLFPVLGLLAVILAILFFATRRR